MKLLEQYPVFPGSLTTVLSAMIGLALSKGLILVVLSVTGLIVVAQAQEPNKSTEAVFDGRHSVSPQQRQQHAETQRRWQGHYRWEQSSIDSGVRQDTAALLGPDSVVSATSLAAPKKARAAFGKAMRELDKGPVANLDKARQQLEKAVAEYPEYAVAWTKLGQVKADTGDSDGAIAALEKSVSLDERFLLPYDALVWLYMAKADFEHAAQLTEFVLNINPAYTKMRSYRAGCAYESGRDDEALALFGEIRDDAEAVKQFPQTHLLIGMIHAQRGQVDHAAAAYKSYLEIDPNSRDAEAIKTQLNEWEQLGVF